MALSLSSFAKVQFIQNKGQWHGNVEFEADLPSGKIYLEKNAFTYLFWNGQTLEDLHDHKISQGYLDCHAFSLFFENANPDVTFITEFPSEEYYNYYLDNDPNKWASGLHGYKNVTYKNLYNHIDLKIEGSELNFKYTFIVHPGGNPSNIKWRYEGANDVILNQGSIIVVTSVTDIIEEQPYTFQFNGTEESEISSSFLVDGNKVEFGLSEYNKNKTLYIDPSVIFSSLSGSIQDNWGFTATYDEDGNGYTAGTVYGADYPVTLGAFQSKFGSRTEEAPGNADRQRDCAIYKLNADGTRLMFATYLGGLDKEQPHSMIVNDKGDLLVLGTTNSSNFPTSVNGFQRTLAGGYDIFVVNFSFDGRKLQGGTLLGGIRDDGINGEYTNPSGSYRNFQNLVFNYGDVFRGEIITGPKNDVYIASTTESSNFPSTVNAYDNRYNGQQDAIIVKLSERLDTLKWSTFLGGIADDAAYSLDLDLDQNVYVTGGTKGGSFPTVSGAYNQSFSGGQADAFVAKISANGTKLESSTLIGTTTYDQAYFIKIAPDGFPWIFGQSDGNFPTIKTTQNERVGTFISKFNKDLSALLISRVFGANNDINITPTAFSVDLCGRVYFSGYSGFEDQSSFGLTTTPDAFDRTTDGRDFYMGVYTADLQTLIYATFFGGSGTRGEHNDGGTSRFDKRGVIYQAICAACGTGNGSTLFPTVPANVYGKISNHNDTTNCNNALVKIDLEGPAIFAEFEADTPICKIPQTLTFTNYTQKATQFTWKMGDGTTYTDSNVTHTYTKPGTYTIELIAFNPIACNLRDTIRQTIEIYAQAEAEFDYDVDICTKEVTFNHTGNYGKTFKWNFGDGSNSTSQNPVHQYNQEGRYRIFLTADDNTDCIDTNSVFIRLEDPFNDFDLVLDSCKQTIKLTNKSKGYKSHLWSFGDGKTETDTNTTHTFADRGKYDVMLTTNIGTECEEESLIPIEIIIPEADFEFEIDTCTTTSSFTNNSLDAGHYKWDFGFGTTSNEGNPTVPYPEKDKEYTVELIAAPNSACADTLSIQFRMPGLPQADFTFKDDTCLSSSWFYGSIVDAPNYVWEFDESGDTAKSLNTYYNFRDTGTFNVRLIAYPNSDCPDTAQYPVIIDTFRFALFDFLLDTCALSVDMQNKSADLDSFFWTFDDGGTAEGENPSHTYDSDGNYTITLYGENKRNGCTDSVNLMVYIPELPEAGNEYLNDSCINTFIFTDTSAFGIDTRWYSSTGDSASGTEFRVHFPEKGNYMVTQISISEYECVDTLVIPINIDSIPEAEFNVTLDSCIGAIITDDNSIGRFRSQWFFGNDSGSFDLDPIINYAKEGIYTITLIINRNTECEDSIQKSFEVKEYQTGRIYAPNVITPNNDGLNDEFIFKNLRPDCDEYQLYIYNRWGNLVHRDEGQLTPWNGTTDDFVLNNSGTELQAGTYFYVMQSARTKLHGTITIVR
ncbi:MAG: PKD domain-containing protein [Bacteroidetes bacterium]|nr:PKD domain-containing protein [Bacteroidota bacterium]